MSTAYWCVLAAALLPYAFTGLAKFSGPRRYDNHAPRDYLDKLDGWRKRAHWAQLNSFEAFAPFAAGVIIAQQSAVAQTITIHGTDRCHEQSIDHFRAEHFGEAFPEFW